MTGDKSDSGGAGDLLVISWWAVRVLSVLVSLIGGLVLAGWALDIQVLKRILPNMAAMNPVTAVTFVLAGPTLWLASAGRTAAARSPGVRRVVLAGAGVITLVGAVTLVGYLADQNLELDRAFFSGQLGDNRISLNSGLNFVLVGAALGLLAIGARRGVYLAQAFAVVSAGLALFAIVGHLYDASRLDGIVRDDPMAVNTAIAVILLDLGILAARPDVGLAALATSPSSGGMLLRRLLPHAIVIPIAVNWLRLKVEYGFFGDIESGTMVFAMINITVLSALIVALAWQLDRIDRARKQAEEERDSFFTQSLDLLCIAGLDGYFKRLNPAFSRVLGYPEAELLRQPFLNFVHPDDREATVAEVARLAAGFPTIGFENRYRCADGSYRWLVWTVARSGDRLYGMAHDVTERKEAELALAAANRELEAFSYSVSHDLRAPLRSVDGFSRILIEDYAEILPDDAKRLLGIVRDGAIQMGRLIDDLLAFSRLGRHALRTGTVDPASIVTEVLDARQDEIAGRPVEIVVDDLPACRADPALLTQVYANLLDNALKYTRGRDPARIRVGAMNGAERGGERTYFVEDNGVGFDMAYAEKLFGVFQRLHRAEDYEGTGVGLALVQRIVHRHGGRVWAESVVDHGATFWFTLPDAASGEQPAEEMTAYATRGNGGDVG